MEDLKRIIADNIAELRKSLNWTQAELAERLNYSDKAVSKWERGESVPDVAVLKQIADLFGVTVDYLLQAEHPDPRQNVSGHVRRNRVIITLLSISLVFLIATLVYSGYGIFASPWRYLWLVYLYAVPVAAVVALVFNSIWGKRRRIGNCVLISVLVWSILLSLYLSFLSFMRLNLWLLFLPGIPAQIIILLWCNLKIGKKSRSHF